MLARGPDVAGRNNTRRGRQESQRGDAATQTEEEGAFRTDKLDEFSCCRTTAQDAVPCYIRWWPGSHTCRSNRPLEYSWLLKT